MVWWLAHLYLLTSKHLPPLLGCRLESGLGLEFSDFRLWHFLKVVIGGFSPDALRRVAYPCLKARKARWLRNTEICAMQQKQGWKLGGSGFQKNKNKQQRQLFMCYHHSQPKTGKIIMGKLNEKNNNKKWRSKTAHDKEAHSSKIKWPTSSATADWSKI